MSNSIITRQEIENRIYTIRGQQVMLDSDLERIYQVETKVFNQAVKRNTERFTESFRFQLTQEEFDTVNLRSQIVTSSLWHQIPPVSIENKMIQESGLYSALQSD